MPLTDPDLNPQQFGQWIDGLDLTVAGPELKNLTERLHFDFKEGMAWLDSRRVLVLQSEWFIELREELLSLLGHQQTRGILTRLGYAAGCRDAQIALKLHSPNAWRDLIFTGGQLHALQGSVAAIPLSIELDLEAQHCHIEFLWKNSIEGQSHTENHSISSTPSCWMEVGYASGFMTTCLGTQVIIRETECRALGHACCRGIARFAHEWGDVGNDLMYFTPIKHQPPASAANTNLKHSPAPDSASTELTTSTALTHVIGRSASFNAVLHQVHQVADTMATVLLLGESGVGKSAFAREIHQNSKRHAAPFVELNCAAIPETLLEAELFGVEKGAYTGAGSSRPGRFEAANGGTLFLDEIGILTLPAQGKILRVLQSQQFERLGSSKTQHVNVRLIAATNEDLETAVKEGRFRLDLFYRLNVFPIHVPPLRERKEDLPALIDHFIRNYSERHARNVKGITPRGYRALLGHSWPGNIRELENILERAVILCPQGEALDMVHLFTNNRTSDGSGLHWLNEVGALANTENPSGLEHRATSSDWVAKALGNETIGLVEMERQLILAAIAEAGNNIAKAAKRLGVSRAQLDYRLKKWNEER